MTEHYKGFDNEHEELDMEAFEIDAHPPQMRRTGLPPRVREMLNLAEAPATTGQKHDQGKPRMELLDRYALEQTAEVLTFGAKKYAPHNWRGGIAYSRLTAAAMRHLLAFNSGEDNDPETGLPHIAHLMCCAMFILGLSNVGSENDDRYKPSSKEKTNG